MIDKVMLEDEEHGLLFYLTDRVFSHIDESLEIYKLVIPRVLNRDIEQILYPDVEIFDEIVNSGLMYKGTGTNFDRFELHDSVKSAIMANNKRTMRLHHSSHHDNPKIATVHTQIIEYYQTYMFEKNINKELEICYHSMLLRKDFERDFGKDREEFVELAFKSLFENKKEICKNYTSYSKEEIEKLIKKWQDERENWLSKMSQELYSRLTLESQKTGTDVLNDINLLKELRKEDKFEKDSILYYIMGITYGELKEYGKAIQAYQKAIDINPKDYKAYTNMGLAYYMVEEYEKAIEAYLKAIEINPKNDNAYVNLGFAYYTVEEYEKAIEAFAKSLGLMPDSERKTEILKAIEVFKAHKDVSL